MRRWSAVVPFALAALAAGCKSPPKPEPEVAPEPTGKPAAAASAEAKPDTATDTSGSIHIDDKILKACGDIPTAHFAFDSSRIGAEAAAALDALARCFSTGPLKGRAMKLIGHADQRGEFEYNMALGQRRAGSVADYLGGHGMARGKIAASSRGELDATGTDEAGWARDRKVDVLLGD
jgi:peptidoglycan-associated lipoprotein